MGRIRVTRVDAVVRILENQRSTVISAPKSKSDSSIATSLKAGLRSCNKTCWPPVRKRRQRGRKRPPYAKRPGMRGLRRRYSNSKSAG